MHDDEELQPDPPPKPDEESDAELGTRSDIAGHIDTIYDLLTQQRALIRRLEKQQRAQPPPEDDPEKDERLASWAPFPPPPAAEECAYEDEDPLFTLINFVDYYNETYVGNPGTRAIGIPDCWMEHPGLVAEIATLTYTWRAAHVGAAATARDAQAWHNLWRPGFADRMITEWTHTHCLGSGHKAAGLAFRPTRYLLDHQARTTDEVVAQEPADLDRGQEPDELKQSDPDAEP